MPAPLAGDSWFSGRHFGIVIDAGSSGSRLQIYSWKNPAAVIAESGKNVPAVLPHVEKGARDGEEWSIKIEPGISTFADHPQAIASYLRPLLEHARDHVPPSLQPETPLFLLATAGMRLLPTHKQAEVLREACSFLTLHSNFKLEGASSVGPCGNSVLIITGEEEGLFGWIAVNYLMDGFVGSLQSRTTYGFLDMGGASTQIAFEPGVDQQKDTQNLIDVRLRVLTGEEINHKVFVTTWLGYGTNKARERYVGKAINEFEQTRPTDHTEENDVVPDPCLPRDLVLKEEPVQPTTTDAHNKNVHTLHGTGSFEQCMRNTAPLLNRAAPCPDVPCLMNGVHVPAIDFSVSHFIGVSEYWYSSENVFGLGGPYDFVQYERAASEFCGREWASILKQHNEDKKNHRIGGDGEVIQNGTVVDVGQFDDDVEISRLQMQCFKAAWVANVLHEGIGMPRIVDPGGNSTTAGDKVADQAKHKGLGRPTFQSVDTVGDIAISWTLGKMVLEASKEVPLPTRKARPLQDPVDDMQESKNSPIHPIRPFIDIEAIEDKLAPHLPSSLSRSSLGFSPVLFLFWMALFTFVLCLSWPMRRRIRLLLRRVLGPGGYKKNSRDSYLMEEGKILTGGSLPPSPTSSRWFGRPVRQLLNIKSKPRPSGLSLSNGLRPTSARASPTRSYSLPNFNASATASSTQYGSRSPSPSPGLVAEDALGDGGLSSFTSRSRNASQKSLSSLAARPVAISRVNSGLSFAHDE